LLHVAHAKGNRCGIGHTVGRRNPHRVSTNQRDAPLFTGVPDLLQPQGQHRPGEVDTEHSGCGCARVRAGTTTRLERHIRRAGADVDQRLASRELE
jgi:hypothetical protein